MDKNYFQLIGDLNQSANPITKMHCPIFSYGHTSLFNTGIGIDYKDEQEMANRCKEKGLLDDIKGGSTKCFDICNDYIKELKKTPGNKLYNTKPDTRLIKTTIGTSTYKDLIKNNYGIRVGISVNKKFLQDLLDGKIDTINFDEMIGDDFKHFFMFAEMNTNQYKGGYIVDSYFGKRKSLISNVKLSELEKVMYPTVYSVIPV